MSLGQTYDFLIGYAVTLALRDPLSSKSYPFCESGFRAAVQTACAEVERKRSMAIARNPAPIKPTKTNCGQTTSILAPR